MNKYAFGVDIGGTSIKMGLFDTQGNLLDKWEILTNKENHGSCILPEVADSIHEKMKERNLEKAEIVGVGVGSPGPVDAIGTVHGAVNLGWDEFNIPKVLAGYLDMPVKAGNDANVAALGEMWQGGGKGYRNLVAVTLGTGVGGGIIIDGEILTGATGSGGEIGHIHIEDNEEVECNCHNKGCFEQYASATGIARLAKRRLEEDGTPSVLRKGNVSAKTVFDAVKKGDEVAIEIAHRFGNYMGKGLAMIAGVVDPEVFVIGGGVSKAGDILFEYITPYYQKYAFSGCRNVKFELAKLGNDAGIFGAAELILKK